jgi:uncharacterized membrane protein
MDKMIVVVFDSEREAYDGTRVLKDLHAEGSITVYGQAVLSKDASGQVTVKEAADAGPLGTAVGLVTGTLVGILGGPVGMAVGAAAGTYSGALYDLGSAGVGESFLGEAAERLEPGKAALLAEIEEEWIMPLDTRMEAVGGTVLRRTRGEVVDAQIARDVAAIEADIDAMEAEAKQVSGETKAKLQAKIDAAKGQLQQTQERARASVEAAQREGAAKIAALREQATSAQAGQKQHLEKRQAEVEVDYQERTAKLKVAGELRKEAGKLTQEALRP